jgi:formamidopyrimidine-DNA glycosylase
VPELPDITIYIDALSQRIQGRTLQRILIKSPFLLRTFDPPLESAEGRRIVSLERLGKRIAIGLEDELFLVIHLMIAGRLLWKPAPASAPESVPLMSPALRGHKRSTPPRFSKPDLAAFLFDSGTLMLTEASQKKRASLHLLRGQDALRALDPGGIDPLTCTRDDFAAALARENRTLKRALASPHLFSGIGNAYSDEILHAARLGPITLTSRLAPEEITRLHAATRDTLNHWIAKLRREFKLDRPRSGRATGGLPASASLGIFPGKGKITAFRPDFAVHGRYGKPCPVCGSPVQRIVHAENETNYCPTCQTAGRILADRSLSRLLKDDWPRTLEEWEEMRAPPR